MSYDIYLNGPDGVVEVPNHSEGGTYALGGIPEARLNVTYNYRPFFDYRWLDGKEAADTIEYLTIAVDTLGVERDEDYWKPTEGNAGYACSILLRWALAYPDATWEVN